MADQNRALYDAVLFDHEGGEDDLRACVASCERASDILEKIALAVSARGTPAALDASRNAVRISFEHGGSDKCKLSALWHLTENMMTSLNAPHPALDDGLLALLRQVRFASVSSERPQHAIPENAHTDKFCTCRDEGAAIVSTSWSR